MTMDDRDLTRLADIGAAARPDWNARSLRAFLAANFATRAFADVAVALVAVAVQPENQTPRLLLEHGPWWVATGAAFRARTETPGPGREPACERVGHEHELARNCRACAAERLADTTADAAPMRPAPPPPEVVAVANRHRVRSGTTAPVRDFAQTVPMPPLDLATVACSCGAVYLDTTAGRDAHDKVFGHRPTLRAPVGA